MSTLESAQHRKPLRLEVANARQPREDHPRWLRVVAKSGPEYQEMRSLMQGAGLHTVCAEAGCPNIFECWEDREATFLIGGAVCTRRCGFCDVASGKPEDYDRDEPRRLAETVKHLGLKYVTVTGVSRDDLENGASWLYAESVRQIRALSPETGVELLVDDFQGKSVALEEVFASVPQVFGHNLETVARLMHTVRPAFTYARSLDVITQAKQFGLITKSNLMLGLGEEPEEIEVTMRDMLNAGVDILTLTQYLRPSERYLPVARWVKPEEFVQLKELALDMGFAACMFLVSCRQAVGSGDAALRAFHSAPVCASGAGSSPGSSGSRSGRGTGKTAAIARLSVWEGVSGVIGTAPIALAGQVCRSSLAGYGSPGARLEGVPLSSGKGERSLGVVPS